MVKEADNGKTTGQRLRAWRKSVPFKLMELSEKIQVSQGSLSDLENDKSLPSATRLANLSLKTDLNIFWLLTGKGPVHKKNDPDIEKTTETSQLYEDFLYLMQDKKLKTLVENLVEIYRDGDTTKRAQITGFLSALK
ncbi:MAG: helix-turn-helix transcriptional regulator [Nitrospinota bacterium]